MSAMKYVQERNMTMTALDIRNLLKPRWRKCDEQTCNESIVLLISPKTGHVVPICDLHGQNHFRCCTNPAKFTRKDHKGRNVVPA